MASSTAASERRTARPLTRPADDVFALSRTAGTATRPRSRTWPSNSAPALCLRPTPDGALSQRTGLRVSRRSSGRVSERGADGKHTTEAPRETLRLLRDPVLVGLSQDAVDGRPADARDRRLAGRKPEADDLGHASLQLGVKQLAHTGGVYRWWPAVCRPASLQRMRARTGGLVAVVVTTSRKGAGGPDKQKEGGSPTPLNAHSVKGVGCQN